MDSFVPTASYGNFADTTRQMGETFSVEDVRQASHLSFPATKVGAKLGSTRKRHFTKQKVSRSSLSSLSIFHLIPSTTMVVKIWEY